MTDPMLPPGWYDSEADGRRFWDGEHWLTAAASPAVPPTRGLRLGSRAVLAVRLAAVVLVAAGLATTAIVRERHQAATELAASQAAAASASQSASLEASASAVVSKQAEIQRGIEAAARTAASKKAAQQAADDTAMDEKVNQLNGRPWTVVQSGHLYAPG